MLLCVPLLKPSDEIVEQMPSYQSLSVVAKEIDCSIIEYRPGFEQNWEFDLETLKTKITSQTRLLILNYPHNPTGACLTDSEMASIVELCRESFPECVRLVGEYLSAR